MSHCLAPIAHLLRLGLGTGGSVLAGKVYLRVTHSFFSINIYTIPVSMSRHSLFCAWPKRGDEPN